MHLKSATLRPSAFPNRDHYPFNVPLFYRDDPIPFTTPVTFFIGENGSGKTTLLEAIARRCQIHIWRYKEARRFQPNPYEQELKQHLSVEWSNGPVPGSFFSAQSHREFALILDEWAATDPGQLKYFGGESLVTQSHGQSTMALFRSAYRNKGIYFSDEPETALSPKRQVELVRLLANMGHEGRAQFIIATHSPILLACPGATIYDFNRSPLNVVAYEETEYYQIYRQFLDNRELFLNQDDPPQSATVARKTSSSIPR